MTIVTYTRKAKCKDCKFCKSFYDGKKKKHICTNEESERYNSIIFLKNLVCSFWKLL